MNYQEVIKYKLQTLIDLMLTDGVSPSDLSNNIFEKDYISISFCKENECIVGRLDFYDNENSSQNIQMIYTYSDNKRLIKIEEIINNTIELLWDRESREEELIKELISFMNYVYDSKQIEVFILSLPEILKAKVMEFMHTLIA